MPDISVSLAELWSRSEVGHECAIDPGDHLQERPDRLEIQSEWIDDAATRPQRVELAEIARLVQDGYDELKSQRIRLLRKHGLPSSRQARGAREYRAVTTERRDVMRHRSLMS